MYGDWTWRFLSISLIAIVIAVQILVTFLIGIDFCFYKMLKVALLVILKN